MHRFTAPRRRHAWRLRITQLTIGLSLVVGLCASAFVSVGAHSQARANQRQSAATTSTSGPRAFPYRTPRNPSGMAATRALTRGAAPRAGAAPLSIAEQTANFNGISNVDQTAANGGIGAEVTPPDQGLCAGHDPTLPTVGTVVFESVNDATAEYDTHGNLLRPILSNTAFFHDPTVFSDPRCFYDATTSTFFFTVIASASGGGNDSFNDVLVLNSHGTALYKFDTSEGATCFGDQPHVGYDNNALYIATDQFCNSGYLGALLQVISKPQLVSELPTPNVRSFTNLSIGGIPVLTLEPAISPHQNTEYLLNSFPFDANGNTLASSNQLGLWQVLGDQNVTTGSGTVSLSSQLITTETYAFPVPAASTGNGSVTNVCGIFVVCVPVESEASLNPDDDRMLQTVVVGSDNSLQLWGALTTALTPSGDTATRDGAAWFKIGPLSGEHFTSGAHIASQGYLAVNGSYLIYPAIYPRDNGTATIVFTMTSPTLNPSAAYAVTPFGATVTIAATGAGPHMSFADPLFGRKRWGDYSAVALDPTNGSFWEATEYIPPPASQDPFDNWGTRVFNIKVS